MTKAEREAKRKEKQAAAEAKKRAADAKREQKKAERAEKATDRKSRALGFIQVAWVCELMLLMLVVSVYVVVLSPVRLELFGRLLTPLIGAILAEGLAAFAGPNVKRWLKGKYGKTDNTGN
jgi:hypothetical protein